MRSAHLLACLAAALAALGCSKSQPYMPRQPLSALEVVPPEAEVGRGGTVRFWARGFKADGQAAPLPDCQWEAADPGLVAHIERAPGAPDIGEPVDITAGDLEGSTLIRVRSRGLVAEARLTIRGVAVESVAVTPSDPEVAAGGQAQLAAEATFVDGSRRVVTGEAVWESLNPAVAEVDGQGLVTGVANGSTDVTASFGGKSGSARVRVSSVELVRLQLEPSEATLVAGVPRQLRAVAVYSDATVVDVTEQASWSSSDESVARPDSETLGLVQALAPGEAIVTARFKSASASARLHVVGAKLEQIQISPPTLHLARGSVGSLTAIGVFSGGLTADLTNLATWQSQHPNVASVGDAAPGKVWALEPGTAVISATYLGVEAATQVLVTPATLSSIVVTPVSLRLAKGLSATFVAIGTYSDSSTQDLTAQVEWSSSAPAKVSVGNAPADKGRARALAVGTATIVAALWDKAGSATVTVTPAAVERLALDPESLELPLGFRSELRAAAFFTDGTNQDVTDQASWTSSAPLVASVTTTGTARGQVTALSEGEATVVASFGGEQATALVRVTPAMLQELTITPGAPSLPKGTELALRAEGRYSDGAVRDVTELAAWTSQHPKTAPVSNVPGTRGRVTGLLVGQSQVRAELEGVSASVTVTVTPAVPLALRVVPATLEMAFAETRPLAAMATYSDGSTLDVTESASWISGDPTIASVTSAGLGRGQVTGNREGETTVRASFEGLTATAQVRVRAPAVQQVLVSPGTLALPAGRSASLSATAVYQDGTQKNVTSLSTWASSSDAAKVSPGGLVTAVHEGSATVTATFEGLTGACAVTVKPEDADLLTISPTTVTLPRGGSQEFRARVYLSAGSSADVTENTAFLSSDVAVLGIHGNVATGMAEGGPVTVTARYQGLEATAQVLVVAPRIVKLVISPDGITVGEGSRTQLAVVGIYSDGSQEDLTTKVLWSSSNHPVASIANDGVVTALKPGSATITAAYGANLSDSIVVNVVAATLTRVAIYPHRAVLRPNLGFTRFRAYALFDNRVEDITLTSTWTSSNPSVAEPMVYTEPGSGLQVFAVWARGAGQAELRVPFEGKVGRSDVQVKPASVEGYEISPSHLRIGVGVVVKMYAVYLYSDGFAAEIGNPPWRSTDPSVATIDDNGVVTALKVGTTTIRVSGYNAPPASARVDVTPAQISELRLDVPEALAVGLSRAVGAVGVFDDGSHVELGLGAVWSTSNASLASIEFDKVQPDRYRLVAHGAGTVTVTASYGGKTANATLKITSAPLKDLALTAGQTRLPFGATAPLKALATYSDGTQVDVSDSVTFQSTAPDVAMANYGLYGATRRPQVVAVWPGDATVPGRASIGATLGSLTDWVEVEVTGATLASIALAANDGLPGSSIAIAGPGPHRLRAIGTFSDGSVAEVTSMCRFSPGKPGTGVVATISNVFPGEVTVSGVGTQKVTARYAPLFMGQPDRTGEAQLRVQ